jgi:hypothetical protein
MLNASEMLFMLSKVISKEDLAKEIMNDCTNYLSDSTDENWKELTTTCVMIATKTAMESSPENEDKIAEALRKDKKPEEKQ